MTELDREINRIKEIMLIHEGKQNVLQEYHRDQKFPTEDFGKTNAEAFLDWLEDKGKYGALPPSKMSFEEGVKSGLQTAAKWGNISEDELYDSLVNNKYGFWNQHIEDKNGNLYVEREISIPNLDKWDKDFKYYDSLIKKYENNVGGCWAWKPGNARAYCSYDSGDAVVLKGYIRMEDVDWVETDYINSSVYSMPNECEVRVKPNAKVELFEVETSLKITKDKYGREKSYDKISTYKLPLKGNLIVTSTYFGNNSTYKGDYAHLYDAQSNVSKFIDRQGNVIDFNDLLSHNEVPFDLESNTDDFSIGQEHDGLRKISYFLPDNIIKYNFIDANNNLLLSKWLDYATDFENGVSLILKNKRYYFINTKGQMLSPNLWFNYVYDFINGIATVEKHGKYNFISRKGQLVSPNLWFDFVEDFYKGYAKVKKGKEYNLIDTNGEFVSPNLWFDFVGNFGDCWAVVKKRGKYNFINTNGEFLSPNLWFDDADDFDKGLAFVQIDGKCNFINTNGEFLSPNLWFDFVEDFYKGYAKVKKGNEYNLIDRKGKLLFPEWF